ncbi:S46 family peptidase [Saccharicrinis aurantiacus]|uniref:S46 family peptidase n=1 Tax=Saccharicrinis aurantiacus TaxID=1849719 RepID=UPI000837B14B|nr:S46 family peptidase [Saccharicrinis aurantiacus]
MRKITMLIVAALIAFSGSVKADEGMWLLPLISKLNVNQMNDMGLKLSAEDIYSINNSSLKDAVVIFGGGCTGELISDKGLILTNHHCGYGNIQALSSVDHNYLKDGFWAKSLEEELPSKGLAVTFLKYMNDVTEKVLEGTTDAMEEGERNKIIAENKKALIEEASKDNKLTITVQSYLEGNQYFIIAYQKYTDVRFVGAPPSSIGKFGFDTDNWMWPRHTGDFSMFRVYADKDGNPAEYSEDNVPLKPVHHLPVSLKGVEMDDFAMTIGFPGSTNRYLTSWGIEERMNIVNDSRIIPRGAKQELWHEAMMADEKTNIQYASKYSRSTNYWKNSIGMNRGLKKLKVIDSKREIEAEFAAWINESDERKELYGSVLSELENAYSKRATNLKAQYYMIECMFRGTEIISLGTKTSRLADALEEGNEEKVSEITNSIKASLEAFYKDYNVNLDQKVFATMLKLYHDYIDAQFYPSFYNDVVAKKYKNDFTAYANVVFKKSVFTSQEKFETFLAKPSLKVLQKDPVYIAAVSAIEKYKEIQGGLTQYNEVEDRNNRLFLKGLMAMNPDKVYYSDANFTMRLSYGKVGNYEPKDAVIYKHFTTLEGVMEKEQPGNYEFEVPAKLKELYETKDYGQYADKDGSLHVCFTTNNDITGGNSGSPVINANGELFGLAFDGNWEAMSGDIAFETELQKCINVDIRYVLFVIDKYAGATNLIEEMTLVK